MFTIYSDKNIFESLISSFEEFPNWNRIINDHAEIVLDTDQAQLDTQIEDPENIIFLFLHSNARSIELKSSKSIFQNIYSKLETVLDDPKAVYFLNLTQSEAEKLQEDTGIIINCGDKIDDDILLKGVNLDWLADEEIQNNWTNILTPFYNYPSNSIIINDRNLFSNEERRVNIGVNNILRILGNILPTSLSVDYHVLIQTEQKSETNNKSKCDDLARLLNEGIRELRNYNFQIEIIFYFAGTSFYKHTHNRRIYSNYKYGKSENSLASFKIHNLNITRNDDSFSLISFFNRLDSTSDTQNYLIAHRNGTNRSKEITADCVDKINKNGPNDRYYRYYLNGSEIVQGQAISIYNRLLN
jgi:alkylated DNA nucleotide flippase Atl1